MRLFALAIVAASLGACSTAQSKDTVRWRTDQEILAACQQEDSSSYCQKKYAVTPKTTKCYNIPSSYSRGRPITFEPICI
jgi:hypothetical protein